MLYWRHLVGSLAGVACELRGLYHYDAIDAASYRYWLGRIDAAGAMLLRCVERGAHPTLRAG